MNVQSSKPFFAADNVCGLHEVVVNYVSKVISRNAVGFEQNDVLIIFRQLDVAFYQVVMGESLIWVTLGAEAQNVWFASFDVCFDFFKAQIAAFCPFTVVTEVDLHFLLFFTHFGQLFFGAEAWVSKSAFYQLFCEGLVDVCALTLSIWTISTVVAIDGSTFIEV